MKRRTAWIIGTGPSLKNIDVSLLKNKHTITFNRAYVAYEDWGFDPTFYLSIDANDMRAVYKDINNLITNSNTKVFFLPKINDNLQHDEESFQDGDKKENLFMFNKKVFTIIGQDDPIHGDSIPKWVASMNPQDTRIDFKNRNIYTYHDSNSGIMALKILKRLGYSEIAFVGCDARYRDDEESNKFIDTSLGSEYVSHENYDVNHFRDDYFGKGMRFGKPNERWIIACWKHAAKQLKDLYANHIKVYSCTEGSNLNEFYKYIPYEEFLKGKR